MLGGAVSELGGQLAHPREAEVHVEAVAEDGAAEVVDGHSQRTVNARGQRPVEVVGDLVDRDQPGQLEPALAMASPCRGQFGAGRHMGRREKVVHKVVVAAASGHNHLVGLRRLHRRDSGVVRQEAALDSQQRRRPRVDALVELLMPRRSARGMQSVQLQPKVLRHRGQPRHGVVLRHDGQQWVVDLLVLEDGVHEPDTATETAGNRFGEVDPCRAEQVTNQCRGVVRLRSEGRVVAHEILRPRTRRLRSVGCHPAAGGCVGLTRAGHALAHQLLERFLIGHDDSFRSPQQTPPRAWTRR
ncbi:MAG TPA: hypothetical protein VFD59_09335 [Nocardioidaceae bacterium]|nr:hypothetical protein [Nocardioidaceae bacterium]